MGLAFATRFAAEGMKVVLSDVEEPPLMEAVETLRATGAEVLGVVTDVADAAAVQSLADQTMEAFGQVNIVCNNAGVAGSMSGGALSVADWKWVIDVNLFGVIHGHASFLPLIQEHGDGHIINTASVLGHFPAHSAYAASKWAVVGITEGLFNQLREEQSTVGVSCLCPGWVNTRINESARNRPEWAAEPALDEPDEEAEMRRALLAEVLASGMQPDEVAGLVVDAVLNNKFWIFTDLDMIASLEPRFQAILENRNPDPVGIGAFLDPDD